MVKKGEWVRIHAIVLKAEERTAKLPEDTQSCDLQMWTKGFLQEDAEIGDTVTVMTAANRLATGTLIEVSPYYTHSYGKFVPEIVQIDKQLREIMFGGEK
ncbi:MAG: 2-amino-4-oxopentanoate thiolase subunit OrtA [Peptostreptococcaceae bacterium]|nr:2-amino-4-oxopentanoate thiolase subunit OrtA [Peptostreptococcaceae bacterium]MDY5739277.1 2-amino-4-oxopentanoate thiolase subunit OrtA [Anaerovoracaceae bacterium]